MNELDKERINNAYNMSQCLTNLGVHHIITDGALLGFIREKGLIEWDWDIEISTRYVEFKSNLINIIEAFDQLKIGRVNFNNSYENPKLTIFQDNFKYCLNAFHYSKDEKVIYRKMYKFPSKFLDEISTIKINGLDFPIPKNHEDLLALEYGKDWRIPLKSFDKNEYKSNKVYTKKNNKILNEFFRYLEISKYILSKFIKLPRRILSKYPIMEYYMNLNREQLFIEQLNFVCRDNSKVIFVEIGSSDLKEAIILSRINQKNKIICKIFEASSSTYHNLLKIRDTFRVKNLEILNKAIVPSKLNYILETNKNPNMNKMIFSQKLLKNKSNNMLLSNIDELKIEEIHKLVKMDIEGLEEKLLIENISFIKKLKNISFAIELHQSRYNNNLILEKALYELLENRYKILFIELSQDCNRFLLNKLKKTSKIFKKASGRFLIKYPPIDCLKDVANTDYRIIKNRPYFSNRNIRSITLTKVN